MAISALSALPTRTSSPLPWASAYSLSSASGTSAAVASFDSKLQENLASIGADSSITSDYFRSLHGNQASEQQNYMIQGEPQGNVASEQRPAPHFDLSNSVAIGEADMEAQLQHALFGEAAGLSSAQPVGFGSSRIPPIAVGADLPIAEAILLEPAPAEEFGQDMASMIEVWKKNHASGGIADDSLDVSRASTVCRGLQGLGLDGEHNSPPEPRQASVTKRRNSQVERRNSQGDSPAPGAPAMRMRGFAN